MNLDEGIRALRHAMIAVFLEQHHGNVCRAARALGIHRNTLNRQMEDLEIAHIARECRADRANYGSRRLPGVERKTGTGILVA
jgi:uncharacterized HAD superfamily protein